jgi:exonuclease III
LFINDLDNIIKKLYKIGLKFIISGDININYLTENDMKKQLGAMLISYNLSSKVHCPTRIQNKSNTAIDNIFIHTFQFKNYIITPMINGFSNHDAQLLMMNAIICKTKLAI